MFPIAAVQKRTLIVLSLLGLVYFCAFCFPNVMGARDENMLRVFSNDETITYPYVVHMLETPKDIHDFTWRLFIYGDYHYGYLFYFFSMLSVLPVKIIFGDGFTAHTQLNLLLLRQMISVLPMILSAGALTFLQTRFCSLWRSVVLFVLILVIPAVVRNNMWWWHPDALSVLCVALTLVFLSLDQLRLGRYFFLAAISCGLAIAIKLVGFFFVFALAGYVAAAWLRRIRAFARNPVRRVALSAGAFILVMSLVVVFSNPFLFYATQRAKLVRIQTEKSQELMNGYTHDAAMYYQKGPQWWVPTLERWYGPMLFLAGLLGLVGIGSLWGNRKLANRLLLAWIIPYSIYLFYGVAVKPDHYWLPVMLPLFSGALNGIHFPAGGKYRWLVLAFTVLCITVLAWRGIQFIQADAAQYAIILGREAAKGY